MTYFSNKFIAFFRALEKNNSKEWFDENRKLYEKEVKEPFKLFVSDLIKEIQAFDSEIMIEPKNAIFRINRDIRFSPDKRPYKTNVAAFLGRKTKKETFPGYFLHLDARQIMFGGGVYSPSKEELYKIRQEILYNYKDFTQCLTENFQKTFNELQGEENKILKPPFKEAAHKMPYLYKKQFYYMQSIPIVNLENEDILQKIASQLKTALPFNEFLREALEEDPSDNFRL